MNTYYARVFGIHACILPTDDPKAVLQEHFEDFIISVLRADQSFLKSHEDEFLEIH